MVRGLLHRTPLAPPQRSARGFVADHGALLVGPPPPRGPSPPRPSPHLEPRVRRRGWPVRRHRSPRGQPRCKARRHEHVSRRRPRFVPKHRHSSRRHGRPVPACVRFVPPFGHTPRGFALPARPHALATVAPLRPQRHGAPPLCRRPRRCPHLRNGRPRPLLRRGRCFRKRAHPCNGRLPVGAPRPHPLARRSGAGHCTANPCRRRGRGRAPRRREACDGQRGRSPCRRNFPCRRRESS